MDMYRDIVTQVKPPDDVIAGVIEVYDNVIDVCDLIIDTANMMDGWRDAEVYDIASDNERHVNKNMRSNIILDINGNEYTTHPLFSYTNLMVTRYFDTYCDKYHFNYDYIEQTQMLKYFENDHYDAHFDTGPRFPRVVSGLLYLNDVPRGGETYFENFDVSIKPKEGRLVIFPANYAYSHAALPVKKGVKNVFVYWARESRLD
jgi:Rps23 Pro-64 3,4-dihydroxylase Tpa1-like proline 4-hydroxylase